MIRFSLLCGSAVAALVASPAVAQKKDAANPRARVTVQPYIELSQTIDADLKSGDVLTYTSVAAGIDAAHIVSAVESVNSAGS